MYGLKYLPKTTTVTGHTTITMAATPATSTAITTTTKNIYLKKK